MSTRRFSRRAAALAAAIGAAATLITACGSDVPAPLRVGTDGTPEMQVAAQIYAGALARTGVRVDVGGRASADRRLLDEAAQGDVDLFPAFTGELLTALMPGPDAVSSEDVEEAVNRALPQGVTIGDPAAVNDRRQLILAQTVSDADHLTDLAQCGALPPGLPLVSTGELTAEEKQAFSVCRFGAITERLTPQQVADRVRGGQALGTLTGLEAATALAGRDDVTALRSAESGPMAQDLVPVFRASLIGKPQMKALSRVAGELTTADLAELAARVERGADPAAVANEWIGTHGV
ncbi:ABC transporter substrate-binding protein [Gordonia sihwensis]|uniref:glycine betaine ABC transporter substrate-binding protein n=1 Tax=Gordonia sihwensis TaxID=173559 RepID=UPI001C92FF6D|nr:glycine betaine ABC transporter substrate-binding protein [Gordonia sihwensis]MBY4569537.1 ABC transporter substrate-binding protein [Gordonia sihwensis]